MDRRFYSARISTAKSDLVAECLRRFGHARLRVTGSSMLPSIWPGDTIHVEAARPESLEPGDIVLYRHGPRLFAHRLLQSLAGKKLNLFATRGDALPSPDPPVSSSDILGRVTSIVAFGRRGNRAALRVEPNRALALAIAHCDFLQTGMLRLRHFARILSARKPL